jgi:hypothetical protein
MFSQLGGKSCRIGPWSLGNGGNQPLERSISAMSAVQMYEVTSELPSRPALVFAVKATAMISTCTERLTGAGSGRLPDAHRSSFPAIASSSDTITCSRRLYNALHPTMQLTFTAAAKSLEIAPPTSSRTLRKPRSVTEHVLVTQKHGTQPHLIAPSFPLEAIVRDTVQYSSLQLARGVIPPPSLQGSLSDPQSATSIITFTPAH